MRATLSRHVAARDAMLLSLDVDRAIAFFRAHGKEPSSREAAEAAMHKARTAAKTLPMEARRFSKGWLTARGLTSRDDGDV